MATGGVSTSIGISVEKFNERTMDFLQWLNTFEKLVTSLKIPDNEYVKFLFDWLEPSVFLRIQEELFGQNPYEIPYDKLIALLTEMFTGVKAENVADYRFFTRAQLPYESVDEYVQSLQKLASKCDPTYYSASHIKDVFIAGLYDQEIKELLMKSNLLPFSLATAFAKHVEQKKKAEIQE